MKLNNGYEYNTIYDLSPFLKRITNSTYFNVSKCTVKVSTEDILKYLLFVMHFKNGDKS